MAASLSRTTTRKLATKTAKTNIHYDEEMYGKTFTRWAQLAHKHECKHKRREYIDKICPMPGTYHFDALVHMIDCVFSGMGLGMSEAELQFIAHEAWKETYVYWRDEQPWKSNPCYITKRGLGDERRDNLAQLVFSELDEYDQWKYCSLVEFLAAVLKYQFGKD